MSDKYTPPMTEAEQRVRYYVSMQPMGPAVYSPQREATLDRMLAARDREVAERAWDEGYGHGAGRGPKTGYKNNPYRSGESE